jgi:gluconolactonase
VNPAGSIWFTDPPFGVSGHRQDEPAAAELPHAGYRIAPDGSATACS